MSQRGQCSRAISLALSLLTVFSNTVAESPRRYPASKESQERPGSIQSSSKNSKDSHLIEPGKGIGQIRLGDSRESVFDALDFDSGEEIQTDNCGAEFIALDKKSHPQGDFSIRFQDSKVIQIEAGTPSFQTSAGVKAYDSPERVRSSYSGLRAYTLSGNSPIAFGGVSLIYWIDWTNGVAFLFATRVRTHQRYLYSIIVFKAGGKFCPERGTIDSPEWRELSPYSL